MITAISSGRGVNVDAIVLSGGGSHRLGRDKLTERLGDRPLLGRVTDALGEVGRVIIVGSGAGAGRADVQRCEDPPGGGPVAALAVAVGDVRADVVLTLAGDLPFLTASALRQLVDGLGAADVGLAVDADGRDQYLLAAWRTESLRTALLTVGDPAGARLAALFRGAGVQIVRVELAGHPPPWTDCDTEADLARARTWADARASTDRAGRQVVTTDGFGPLIDEPPRSSSGVG